MSTREAIAEELTRVMRQVFLRMASAEQLKSLAVVLVVLDTTDGGISVTGSPVAVAVGKGHVCEHAIEKSATPAERVLIGDPGPSSH